ESVIGIVERLEPTQAASILMTLSEDRRNSFVERLSQKNREQIRELLTYPENSAGRLMTTEFLALRTDTKVREAIQRIRTLANRKAPASYAYVVNEEYHLVGVINMRDLIIAQGDSTLASIMRMHVFSVNAFADCEEVAAELAEKKYFAAPVVDHENRLLGVIKADQLLGDVQQRATEDIQKLFGAGGDERVFSPISFSLRKRLLWLNVNLATAFLAASVVALFEGIIAKITVLAVFLPVVAGQGGNAGIQTLAVVMRGLVMREIAPSRVWPLLGKEAIIGGLNGLAIGVVTGAIAWYWAGNAYLGIVIGLAMIVNLLAAGLSGAAIPLSMKAMGLDPAQSSGIILTTVTDVVGFFAFLGLAVLFQGYLM
ncbi:MAG: magnesium transporter, partial [Deltaproteobacteria bacterium]|nr:magnesium transporter [Deltaproteobacteria bacterium]